MEFALETATNGNHSNITLQSMETGEIEEVQYIYDDTEMIMAEAGPEYSNVTDLVLEDGTRAMIVNGTLVTADGQTLILQDGTDLSQYSVDENADEIVISRDQEDQFLQIMSTHNNHYEDQSVIHYVQESSVDTEVSSDQQVLYIQDGENILPIQERYHIAELNSQNSEPVQLSVEHDRILDKVEGVIDLEHLLLGQQGPDNLVASNYQYAVLKDGKFHLQTNNGPLNILRAHEVDTEVEDILGQPKELNSADYLDLSAIKGRNLETGQVITLSRFGDKYTNKKANCDFPSKKENVKNKLEDKSRTNVTAPSISHLKKLINKKITIGQTDKGKKLIGKIVNIMKKTDVSKDNNINTVKTIQSFNKSGLVPTVRRKEISKIPVKEIINLVDGEPHHNENNTKLNPGNNNTLDFAASTDNDLFQPRLITMSSGQSDDLEKNTKPVMNLPKMHTSSKDVIINRKCRKTDKLIRNNKTLETSSEYSKIIIQKKIVSKDCFDVISRTLAGLMNMDSVVTKLRNKILIIKIIQKTFSQNTKECEKTVSYCSGYMVREYKLDDEDSSFSESWRFIPDTNSKETILGQDNLTTLIEDGITSVNGLKRFANLTIQITISSEGVRTTRVIVNPPALFQCKACSKSFRTSALLKVHSLDCHMPGFVCPDCPMKFRTAAELKEHSQLHIEQKETNKGMYECVECNQCFQTPGQIRKHMNSHYQPSECPVCKQKLPTVEDLSIHIMTHSGLRLPEPETIADTKQDKSDRKVFSCHICSRQFSRHSNLQRHIEIHQGEGAMYQCAVCSCSYHYISSLTRHVVSCHVDKSKNITQNLNIQENSQGTIMYQGQELEFLQNDQIVQMIPLDHMSEETLQQLVTENIEYGVQDFQETENAAQILQIPVDSDVVIEN